MISRRILTVAIIVATPGVAAAFIGAYFGWDYVTFAWGYTFACFVIAVVLGASSSGKARSGIAESNQRSADIARERIEGRMRLARKLGSFPLSREMADRVRRTVH